MKRTLFACLMLTGCASHFPEATTTTTTTNPPASIPAQQLAPQRQSPRVMPQTIGYSVQGRPIEMYAFGAVEGGRPVIVMGAIHGSETSSAEISRGLLAELANDARAIGEGINGVPVAIIPVANPDGFAAGT